MMGRDHKQASVLILTLWVLFFLSALAIAVGAYVESGLQLARSIRGRTLGLHLARVGVERSIALVAQDTNAWDDLTEDWAASQGDLVNVPWEVGEYTVVASEAADGTMSTGMRDEERRININQVDQSILQALFAWQGGLSSDDASSLAACVVDWRDRDEDVLTGGAENAYYQSLGDRVTCHNGEFQSLYELLWVKGMTDDIMARVEPYITIYGSGKVNLNTADPVVLQVLMLAAGGNSSTSATLLRHLDSFRKSGGVFTSTETTVMTQALGNYRSLTADELSLFSSLLGWVQVRSTCFGGTVLAKPYPPAGPATSESLQTTRRVAFVYDKVHGTKRYWHEN